VEEVDVVEREDEVERGWDGVERGWDGVERGWDGVERGWDDEWDDEVDSGWEAEDCADIVNDVLACGADGRVEVEFEGDGVSGCLGGAWLEVASSGIASRTDGKLRWTTESASVLVLSDGLNDDAGIADGSTGQIPVFLNAVDIVVDFIAHSRAFE
jgi:hypothetical protein